MIPLERNFLLNPLHPEFSRVKLMDTVPFFFDPRTFKTSR